jgi:hypothetical protein
MRAEPIQALALRLLKAMYEQERRNPRPVNFSMVGLNLGFELNEANSAGRYLMDKGLLHDYGGNASRVTAHGIDVIEEALAKPDSTTQAFPGTTINVLNVATMSGSVIQQSGSHAQQIVTYGKVHNGELKQLVDLFQTHLAELDLEARDRKKARTQIETIAAQMQDDEPDPAIVGQALRTLRTITEGAIGGLVATAVQPAVWGEVHRLFSSLIPG